MKRRIISSIVLIALALPALAQCGLKPTTAPLPPLGCNKLEAQCQCDSNDHCYWVWVCIDPAEERAAWKMPPVGIDMAPEPLQHTMRIMVGARIPSISK